MELQQWIQKVTPLDESAMAQARERQAQLAKPPGSLGRLEDLSVQLAGITGKVHNTVKKQHLLVFASDNGVVEEGVASAPQSVTLSQTINLTRAKTGASTLCKHFGCGITVCDVGVNANVKEPKVLNKKIAYGTRNIVNGPAMTREQAMTAILTGIELAANTEADVLGIGEMGIGNTTTSSAVLSVLLDAEVEAVTGRGGGITDASFLKKKWVIKTAIEVNQPDKTDVIDVLTKVGGFVPSLVPQLPSGRLSLTALFPWWPPCVLTSSAPMRCITLFPAMRPLKSATSWQWMLCTWNPCSCWVCGWARAAAVPLPSRFWTRPAPSSTIWPPLSRQASTMTIWTKSA